MLQRIRYGVSVGYFRYRSGAEVTWSSSNCVQYLLTSVTSVYRMALLAFMCCKYLAKGYCYQRWYLSRLETRTKESNAYASVWVVNSRAE